MTARNAVQIDTVLDSLLAQDGIERKFEQEVTDAQTRAAKCHKMAANYFKTRNMRSVTSGDVKALALLLYKLSTPRRPGRPRKDAT